jgi:hypothetical protein
MGIEMKPLEFTRDQWIPLQQRLLQEHGAATISISWRCRRELGFIVRHHDRWVSVGDSPDRNGALSYRETVICLDFYDEEMRTFFILKYHNTDKA